MPLTPGQTFAHDETFGPLGAGGMGEVERAKDTRLDRRGEPLVLTVDNGETGSRDLWIRDLARGVSTRPERKRGSACSLATARGLVRTPHKD